eukprot:173063-Pelagomonas_calceolata.AAC.1
MAIELFKVTPDAELLQRWTILCIAGHALSRFCLSKLTMPTIVISYKYHVHPGLGHTRVWAEQYAHIRVKYVYVTYIRELGGPFWAGR